MNEKNELAPSVLRAPDTLSPDEIGKVLEIADGTIKWLKSVQDYAKDQLINGHPVTGWKLVEGRSSRAWSSDKDVMSALDDMGYSPEEYTSSELLSPAELEKQLGKTVYIQIEGKGLVVKSAGKPTLAHLDDKRRNAMTGAAADYSFLFKEMKGN